MSYVKIDRVTKYFGETKGVDNANIAIKEGEFFTLLGPSGCGKTTLLRTLAGFYQQEEGHIYFGDQCMDHIPVHKRNIGMVFQSYAIFPHMSVFDNVAYGLKARGVRKKEIETRVMEALDMVELASLRDRQPSQLSGGQQQRIALARAVVIHPGLLLMDEPLSNLDAKLRLKMRADIRQLQKRLNITTIYVTHDQEEALAVSDRIAVMKNGVIQQIGEPHQIYLTPRNKFVASFIGTMNFVEAECMMKNAGEAELVMAGRKIQIPMQTSYSGKTIYAIRPEQLALVREGEKAENTIPGVIVDSTFLGEKVDYQIELVSGERISVQEHNVRYEQLRSLNERVEIFINPEQAIMYDQEGKEAINLHGTSRRVAATQESL